MMNALSTGGFQGPAPHGAGGLKSLIVWYDIGKEGGPAPHGAGGLKSKSDPKKI